MPHMWNKAGLSIRINQVPLYHDFTKETLGGNADLTDCDVNMYWVKFEHSKFSDIIQFEKFLDQYHASEIQVYDMKHHWCQSWLHLWKFMGGLTLMESQVEILVFDINRGISSFYTVKFLQEQNKYIW
jgi:hypothetical protein